MSAERPAAFGAAMERARRRRHAAPARPPGPGAANAPALSGWAAGIVAVGVLLALAWIAALLVAPDRIAAALAPAPGATQPAPALAAAASATATHSATPSPVRSLTPSATPSPAATRTPTATPTLTASLTPAASPTPTVALGPTRLVIPAIGVDTSVVAVGLHLVSGDAGWQTEWDVPNGAAGWHNTSAVPGQAGNTVLSGHHNIEGLVFRDLFKLKAGAEVILYAGSTGSPTGTQEFHYRVAETMIVQEQGVSTEQRQENARWIEPFADERLTLVTCWPANNNTHRVIVVAKPVYR